MCPSIGPLCPVKGHYAPIMGCGPKWLAIYTNIGPSAQMMANGYIKLHQYKLSPSQNTHTEIPKNSSFVKTFQFSIRMGRKALPIGITIKGPIYSTHCKILPTALESQMHRFFLSNGLRPFTPAEGSYLGKHSILYG